MDADSQSTSQELPQSTARSPLNDGLVADNSDLPAACALCQRILSPDNEATGDLEAISICGDCKFLFLEDLGSPIQDSHRRRPSRGRRSRYSSSESIENLFSQQFSQMINLARQNQAGVPGHEDQPVDGDAAARLLQPTSSRTTPIGSRRWRRVLSDTESDGFDNMDSVYGESESNVSFGGYRVFHGENDAISFGGYGGESDVSVDGHSFLDTDMFVQPDEGSDLNSDTDIDPMHAGLNQWNSDDQEEEEEESEWEEDYGVENTIESTEAGARAQNFFTSSPSESNGPITWRSRFRSSELRTIRWRRREESFVFGRLDESEVSPYVRSSRDYLDATRFEELLEHLADTESSRRGAPPAAVSFVNSLPRLVINEENEKHDGLSCAICKDFLSIGTEVNQLPCFHLYHPSCILPWLSARNSCPLCRYELPTDDKDYEEGKQNISSGMEIHEIQQQEMSEDSSSDDTDRGEADEAREVGHGRTVQGGPLDVNPDTDSSGREGGRGRWFFLAAAPIVSLVGIVLVLWLGNPLMEGRGPRGHCNFRERGQHQIHSSGSRPLNQRENRRRWWSLF
ncbi:hypothetical protein L1049_008510 [Liquidambar formosana]|uniref:RING-type E3 ubiquitin transferase n=1 Tax=Liquidambar formosana TaxID=63359 RepID=A0AAP0S3M5_LIQFO